MFWEERGGRLVDRRDVICKKAKFGAHSHLLLPLEEGSVADETVLDYLRDTRLELAVGESVEGVGVDEDTLRLVEGPNHVLTQGVVHPRLAPDGGVHHGHHGRGDLDEVHAPLVRGGSESNHIANNPTTEGDKGALAVQALVVVDGGGGGGGEVGRGRVGGKVD